MEYETKDTGAGTIIQTTTGGDADSVNVRSGSMREWLDRSRLPRTLLEGTYGMREASTAFLTKHALETDTAYTMRLSAATLLNAFKKTTSFLAGQVFQSDIIFEEGVDESFQDIIDAADASGNALDVFAKRVFFNGLAKGVSHILIDAPERSPDTVTEQDEKDANLRPYFKEVKPEDILGAIVDEDGFLVQVRIAESTTKRVGNYGTKIVKRIRVLEPGKWSLFEEEKDGSTTEIQNGNFSVKGIPLVTFIPGEEWTIITGETPLMDLADLNSKHWRSSSVQDTILAVARAAILFGKNIELAKMPVGASTMVTSTDDDSDIKFVEHTGKAIEAGQKDLDKVEEQMALYGLQQLVKRTGNVTATEKALTSAESNSSLGTWATEFESILIAAFKVAGEFWGKEFPDNGLTVNKEYNFGVSDPQELLAILKSEEQGIVTPSACFNEFRRRGVYDEHLKWDDMEAEFENNARNTANLANLAGTLLT